jgi:hypothetical protein
MLAFTDAALVHLFLAASRVPQRRRARWLRNLARQLDPSSPTPNALRCRNARQRQNNGVKVYCVPLDTIEVEALLTRERLLAPGRDYARAEVETALAEFINRLCAFDMHVEAESGNDL